MLGILLFYILFVCSRLFDRTMPLSCRSIWKPCCTQYLLQFDLNNYKIIKKHKTICFLPPAISIYQAGNQMSWFSALYGHFYVKQTAYIGF